MADVSEHCSIFSFAELVDEVGDHVYGFVFDASYVVSTSQCHICEDPTLHNCSQIVVRVEYYIGKKPKNCLFVLTLAIVNRILKASNEVEFRVGTWPGDKMSAKLVLEGAKIA